MSITQSFIKAYTNASYKYATLVRHKGTVVAFAMTSDRRIFYTVLNLDDSSKADPRDVNYWLDNPKELLFPDEIAQVGYGIADQRRMPLVKKGSRTEVPQGSITAQERDAFLSSTARLTADVPFQVISDGQYVCVFRQAIAANHSDIVFADAERKVPVVNSSLLLDRFVLVGTQLEPRQEIRFQRSRSKTRPQSNKDSLGAMDMEGKPFLEPTQEIDFVRNLRDGRFSVLLLPTQIAEIKRWQIFAHNSRTGRIDSFNVEQSADGLFNTRGTQFYTCTDHPSVFEAQPGSCRESTGSSTCGKDLIPVFEAGQSAASALQFDGVDDWIDLPPAPNFGLRDGSFTVEAWIRGSDFASDRAIFGTDGQHADHGLHLIVRNQKLFMSFWHNDLAGNLVLEPNVWYHIACCYDKTAGRQVIYINGVLDAERSCPRPFLGSDRVRIGRAVGSWFFRGAIDEVRVWNRARSQAEIRADLRQRLTGTEPGLTGYWRFDEGAGNRVFDLTDGASHGTIHGGATWTRSDAPIREGAGISRTSFGFEGRTIESGLSALFYYQQENAATGYDQQSKPIKYNARLMLAVATRANGSNRSEITVLDMGVNRSGRPAQLADQLTLTTLSAHGVDTGDINAQLDRISQLEQESRRLEVDIQRLQAECQRLQAESDRLPWVQNEYNVLYNELIQAQRTRSATFFEHSNYGGRGFTFSEGTTANVPGGFNDVVSSVRVESGLIVTLFEHGIDRGRTLELRQDTLFVNNFNDITSAVRLQVTPELQQQRTRLAQTLAAKEQEIRTVLRSRDELTQRQAELAAQQQQLRECLGELNQQRDRLRGEAQIPMPLVQVDGSGLTLSGAVLGFAWTKDAPLLFDSATGQLALYFRGINDEFFTAYYTTLTARPQFRLTTESSTPLICTARSAEPEMDAIQIQVAAGSVASECRVSITGAGMTETWNRVPRSPQQFAAVINGAAGEPVYVGTLSQVTPIAENPQRLEIALSEGCLQVIPATSLLQIGGNRVRVDAEIAKGVTRFQIDRTGFTASVSGGEAISVIQYDYAANAQSSRTTGDLSNGSLLIRVNEPGTTSSVCDGAATGGDSTPNCQWVADAPGNALVFNGRDVYGSLANPANLSQTAAEGNLTLETWARPDSFSGTACLIHHHSPNSRYTLGIERANLPTALVFNGNRQHVQLPPLTIDFSQGVTIEAWVFYTGFNHWSRIMDLGNGANADNILLANVDSTRDLNCHIFQGGTPSSVTVANVLELNVWTHVAVTVDASGQAQFYKNGQPLLPTPGRLLLPNSVERRSNFIGRSNWVNDGFLAGCLDDVRLWNRGRSVDEIRTDMNRRLGGNERGLVGYWYFANGIPHDYSPNRNHGNWNGEMAAVTSPIPGYTVNATVGSQSLRSRTVFPCGTWNHLAALFRQSYAVRLDGRDSYLEVPHDITLDLNQDLTLEVFCRLEDVNQSRGLITKGKLGQGNSQQVPYALYVERGGALVFTFEDKDRHLRTFRSMCTIVPGQFYRIAVTREQRTETNEVKNAQGVVTDVQVKKWFNINFYVNRQPMGSNRYEGPEISGNSAPLEIGRTVLPGNAIAPLRGEISEVRCWNAARKANEVCGNINGSEAGLVAWWQIEENQGNVTTDAKATNHASLKPGCSWVKNPDPNGSSLTIYSNGIAVQTEPFSMPPAGNHQFTVGGLVHNGIQNLFQGQLEETRVWNITRTPEQLTDNLFRRLLDEQENLLAYYTYDAQDIQELKDQSLRGNHLFIQRAINFDSVDDAVNLGSPAALQITGNQTIEMWIKPANLGDRQNPFAKAYGGEGTITLEPYGGLSYYYGTGGGNSQPYQGFHTSGDVVPVNVWTHIAIVRDLTNRKLFWYVNGNLVAEETAQYATAAASSLPALIGEGYVRRFCGQIAEVRVWNVVRSQAEIRSTQNQTLSGSEAGLVGYWRLTEGAGTVVRDRTRNGNHGNLQGNPVWAASDLKMTQPYILSTAPISNDTPQVRSALAGVRTPFHDSLHSVPGVQEYGDLQADSSGNLMGVLKRCYSYIKDNQWWLVTGFKVGNLTTEWIGQVQTAPQLVGFIEGAPPVPSENLTDTEEDYGGASAIELTEADSTTYTYASSRDKGFDMALEASLTAGFKSETKAGGGIGFITVTSMEDTNIQVGLKTSFELSQSWLEDASTGTGKTTSKISKMELQGNWENNPRYAALGKRFVPRNVGFALVQSETADVFALRLKHNHALISFQMRPNPDIPKDWNIITFPLNPRYVKQGTLDGKVGFEPDPHYPNALTYSPNSSYFKPIEAYSLKNRIQRQEEQLKAFFDQYNAGGLGRRNSVVHFSSGDLAAGRSLDKLPRVEKHNLVNTYVWTADGGLFTESQETMDMQQETLGGSYAFKGMAGITFGAQVAVSKVALNAEMQALFGGHLNLTVTKSQESERSFGLNVELGVERDIMQRNPQGELVMDTRDPLHPQPRKQPGKVDAYRFMTFYLEPQPQNFDEFFNKVVDPIWLKQSSDPMAIALRQAKQDTQKPPCWRVLHRVTYVSRVLPDFPSSTTPPLEKAMQAIDIDSNYELIKKLEPFVQNKTTSYAELGDAVRGAIALYLPELKDFTAEIIQYMALYLGVQPQ